jgi:hypothetical protein
MHTTIFNGREVSLEFDYNHSGSTIFVGAVYLDDGQDVEPEFLEEIDSQQSRENEENWLKQEGLTRDLVARIIRNGGY